MAKLALSDIVVPGTKVFTVRILTESQRNKKLINFRKTIAQIRANFPIRIGLYKVS